MAKTDNIKEVGMRIKTIRISRGETAEEFGKQIEPPASQSIVSRWERGINLPNRARLEAIAKLGKVTVEYLLTGEIPDDDKDGWKKWEQNTGYSRAEIEFMIKQLIDKKRIHPTIQDKQSQIARAVQYLDGSGKTDLNAVIEARRRLGTLDNTIRERFYEDPDKKERYKKGIGNSYVIPANAIYDGSIFYDDMNKDIYLEISDILEDARNKLVKVLEKYNLE